MNTIPDQCPVAQNQPKATITHLASATTASTVFSEDIGEFSSLQSGNCSTSTTSHPASLSTTTRSSKLDRQHQLNREFLLAFERNMPCMTSQERVKYWKISTDLDEVEEYSSNEFEVLKPYAMYLEHLDENVQIPNINSNRWRPFSSNPNVFRCEPSILLRFDYQKKQPASQKIDMSANQELCTRSFKIPQRPSAKSADTVVKSRSSVVNRSAPNIVDRSGASPDAHDEGPCKNSGSSDSQKEEFYKYLGIDTNPGHARDTPVKCSSEYDLLSQCKRRSLRVKVQQIAINNIAKYNKELESIEKSRQITEHMADTNLSDKRNAINTPQKISRFLINSKDHRHGKCKSSSSASSSHRNERSPDLVLKTTPKSTLNLAVARKRQKKTISNANTDTHQMAAVSSCMKNRPSEHQLYDRFFAVQVALTTKDSDLVDHIAKRSNKPISYSLRSESSASPYPQTTSSNELRPCSEKNSTSESRASLNKGIEIKSPLQLASSSMLERRDYTKRNTPVTMNSLPKTPSPKSYSTKYLTKIVVKEAQQENGILVKNPRAISERLQLRLFQQLVGSQTALEQNVVKKTSKPRPKVAQPPAIVNDTIVLTSPATNDQHPSCSYTVPADSLDECMPDANTRVTTLHKHQSIKQLNQSGITPVVEPMQHATTPAEQPLIKLSTLQRVIRSSKDSAYHRQHHRASRHVKCNNCRQLIEFVIGARRLNLHKRKTARSRVQKSSRPSRPSSPEESVFNGFSWTEVLDSKNLPSYSTVSECMPAETTKPTNNCLSQPHKRAPAYLNKISPAISERLQIKLLQQITVSEPPPVPTPPIQITDHSYNIPAELLDANMPESNPRVTLLDKHRAIVQLNELGIIPAPAIEPTRALKTTAKHSIKLSTLQRILRSRSSRTAFCQHSRHPSIKLKCNNYRNLIRLFIGSRRNKNANSHVQMSMRPASPEEAVFNGFSGMEVCSDPINLPADISTVITADSIPDDNAPNTDCFAQPHKGTPRESVDSAIGTSDKAINDLLLEDVEKIIGVSGIVQPQSEVGLSPTLLRPVELINCKPLRASSGSVLAVLSVCGAADCLVVVQERDVSFWRIPSRVHGFFGADLQWKCLGKTKRRLIDFEVKSPYQNRVFLHDGQLVYVECRAHQSEPNQSRECYMSAVYLNVYFIDRISGETKMHMVNLDTILGVASSIRYVVLETRNVVAMTWTEPSLQSSRCGICKYNLSQELDVLDTANEFPFVQQSVVSLRCFEEDKLLGFTDSSVIVWDHRTGDLLLNLDIEQTIGINLGCFTCSEKANKYMFLVQLFSDASAQHLELLAINLCEPFTWKVVQTHSIPNTFECVTTTRVSTDYIAATFASGDSLLLSLSNPSLLYLRECSITSPVDLHQSFVMLDQVVQIFSNRMCIAPLYEHFLEPRADNSTHDSHTNKQHTF